MQDSTTTPVPSTRLRGEVAGTVEFDVGELALRIADLVVPRVLAGLTPADPEDRNGPYVPDLPRKVPPQRGEHGPGGAGRLVHQACPSCGSMMWADPGRPGELCATCQQHGDLRDAEGRS